MAKGKYYAVAVGRKPGIYTDWATAEQQVKGFAGAVYKGFADRAEAENWLTAPTYNSAKNKVRSPRAALPASVQPSDGEIVIYTDGGSINNPGPGGYGAVICADGEQREISGGFRLTTNNRMEMTACIAALREVAGSGKPVRVFSDSSYLVNGISKGWAKKWRDNGWRKADRAPAINADLWAELLDLLAGQKVTLNWVKGHAGNPLNERCDQLAVASARRPNLPIDSGYEES